MKVGKRFVAAGAVAVVALAAGTGIAVATGGDDNATDTPITGAALEQASTAAVDHVGGGTVSGTEIDDEESYYEVEVRLPDGSQVDVQLDQSFNVVSQKVDRGGQHEAG